LNLLFVGLDWARKGGDIAVAALDQLLAQNLDARLTVVGRCPERHATHPAIRHVGFLNKAKPRDRARLTKLYSEAHLLVLPSRGDCTPMVVAEAMAHGTPVLATDTGGIAEQIGGAGGRVLAQYSTPGQWAEAITQMTRNRDQYAFASDAAFDRANAVFNWDHWASEIATLAQSACEAARRPRIAAAS